jgi:hypothetical protein
MMFDGCMCGWNNPSNFFCLGIDIYKNNLHMVHEKKCKNENSSHKVPTFWE